MKTVSKIAWLSLGWTLVVLGFLGLALPFLQGILLLAFGAVILSVHSTAVREFVRHWRERSPFFDRWYGKLEAVLRRPVGKR